MNPLGNFNGHLKFNFKLLSSHIAGRISISDSFSQNFVSTERLRNFSWTTIIKIFTDKCHCRNMNFCCLLTSFLSFEGLSKSFIEHFENQSNCLIASLGETIKTGAVLKAKFLSFSREFMIASGKHAISGTFSSYLSINKN